jgi:hypothetical protein
MDYKKLLEYLGIFLVSFLLVYSLYYGFIRRPFIRARKKQKEKKMPADLSIIKHFYKVDVEKVGYNYCLRLLNITNSLLISIIVLIIIGFKYYVIKMIIAAALVIPAVWFSYMLVAKIIKGKERKIK